METIGTPKQPEADLAAAHREPAGSCTARARALERGRGVHDSQGFLGVYKASESLFQMLPGPKTV